MAKTPAKTKTKAKTAAAKTEASDASLTDKAYDLIEELIVTLQLAPGSLVSEVLLSKRLGIGRTPVREALHRLARERLVVIMPRRGIFVSDINVGVQLRLSEVRRELERLIARAAARRATLPQRERLKQIGDEMNLAADSNDGVRFLRLDGEFNALMATTARNEFASSALGLMSGLARRFWFIHFQQVADLPRAARLHAAVALAAAAGDGDKAAAASDALLDYIEDFTRATLELDVA